MRYINRLAIGITLLLIIIIPVFVLIFNIHTKHKIEENALTAQNYAKTSAESMAKEEALYAEISKEIPGIVCIGSDLMASNKTDNTQFAKDIQVKLDTEGYKIPVVNLAVQGENTLTILGRLGVAPFVVKESVTIPEAAELVDIKIGSSREGYVWPLALSSENAHINPITINNIKGNIGGDSVRDPQTGENKHYFIRDTYGEAFTIPQGAVINTSCDDEYKDYVHIIWMGENDNWQDYKNLADNIKEIIDVCGKNKDRYIVMGLPKGSDKGMKEYDSIMKDYFGSHYLNVRKFLSDYKLKDTDIPYDKEDIEEQKQGIVPKCLLTGDGSLNDKAYKALINFVYEGLIDNDCIKKP